MADFRHWHDSNLLFSEKIPASFLIFHFKKDAVFIYPKIHSSKKEAPVRWFGIPADRCLLRFSKIKLLTIKEDSKEKGVISY